MPAPVIAAAATATTANSRKRISMASPPLCWSSIGTRAGGLDYASPFLPFRLHEFSQLLRRASHRLRALVEKLIAQLRNRDCSDERLVESLDNRSVRAGRRDHGMPGRAEHAREPDFGSRRDVGQEGRAQGRGDDERLQAPGFDVRQ